jgi:hypothetical protein
MEFVNNKTAVHARGKKTKCEFPYFLAMETRGNPYKMVMARFW